MEYKNCSVAYWGEPDIELKFCENKYETPYIAEYYNSMTAISYMIVGFILIFNKRREAGIWTIFLGIGTFVMHTTLRYYGKWMDEVSMLMLEMVAIKRVMIQYDVYIDYLSFFVFILYFFINNSHFFIVMFFGLLLFIGHKTYYKLKESGILCYTFLMTVSILFWIIDQLFCDYSSNYNFHALWHVGTALAILFGMLAI
jgi:hypothetical protein|uniref:Ceramidase n=1 Tax=viral metagenome TaxID=1070528 RepID=A0A6C0C203_9ZZZZ